MTEIELLKEMITPGSNIPESKPLDYNDIIVLDWIARMRLTLETLRYGDW